MTRVNLSAGDIIEAHCTRCRKTMNHTIVAMVDEHPARVECNTCDGVHNYREAKEAKQARATATKAAKKPAAPRKSRKDPAAADRQEWSDRISEYDPAGAIPYAMDGRFREKDLVEHAAFGLGIVRRLVPPQKVEIIFADGCRLLRCR